MTWPWCCARPVTGARNLTVDVGGLDPIPITALGPLQAVLERAIAADPIGRLTAAELASELLRVAPLLPRPDPLAAGHPQGAARRCGSRPPPDSTEAFRQVGPTVSERSAIPHDDVPRPALARDWCWPRFWWWAARPGGVWAWLSDGSDPHRSRTRRADGRRGRVGCRRIGLGSQRDTGSRCGHRARRDRPHRARGRRPAHRGRHVGRVRLSGRAR